ncbi:MAG: hypothetical protein AAGC68_13740 [Verrucomicrobiota bacterium]
MQPPICEVCFRDQRDSPGLEFDLVPFADYEPIDRSGHPDGLLWFCEEHFEATRKWSSLSSREALRKPRNAKETD